jgi:3(or 17)beta-hydroxysteroid dehydrogenase
MRLSDKIALLTGAAAAIKGDLMGFGGSAAQLFVREGAKVVLTDVRDELGERAASSCAPMAMTRATCTST